MAAAVWRRCGTGCTVTRTRPLARLALLWLRRYLEASRNSGAAASIYFTLSALPTALVVIAFFNLAAKNENAFSNR